MPCSCLGQVRCHGSIQKGRKHICGPLFALVFLHKANDLILRKIVCLLVTGAGITRMGRKSDWSKPKKDSKEHVDSCTGDKKHCA